MADDNSMMGEIPASLRGEQEDLYPADEMEQRRVTAWVQQRFIQAESAKKPHLERWLRYYKAYRSYVAPRKPGQWKSQVWMPISFYVIETILPRLAAQLPSAVVNPIGPEDVLPAKTMEEVLHWAEDKSELFIEQVKAVKSSLVYGTGVMKINYKEKKGYNIVEEPVMEETTSEVATGQKDVDGGDIMQTVPVGVQPVLDENGMPKTETVRSEYFTYQGPVAEAVDIDDFFPDPIASDVEDARYVIHRVYRDRDHLENMFRRGEYKRPPEDAWESYLTEYASMKRSNEIGLSGDAIPDRERDLFPILELWTDRFCVSILGERGDGILLRAIRNPYGHGEKPFIRIVDHLVPHEFWGVGELEPLEGIQDTLNAIWNARIDNVKIALNKMFAVVMDYMIDPNDLVVRPGGVIRMREGLPLNQVFQEIDMGDITSDAYSEVQELEREAEKASGVSPYQTGQDSPAYNRTATGVALISEQGNTRFSFKITLAEHTGYKRLVRQYASILQQFTPDDLIIRIKGGTPEQVPLTDPMTGQPMIDPMTGMPATMPDPYAGWQAITPESITGRFDFDIEQESSAQTISTRREQTLSLAAQLMQDPWMKPRPIREDLLKEFGRKNPEEYLYSEQEMQMMQMAMQQQAALGAGEEEGPPSEAS